METPFRWHAATPPLNGPWAIPVPLQPDELISSWLIRAALAQGCDPSVLTHLIWPGWRIWTRDPDRGFTALQLQSLRTYTHLEPQAAHQATLQPLMERVLQPLPQRAVWPWTLALGSRNRTRRGGLQYCPACLAEDQYPYLRMSARLAWHTVCPDHGILLLDRCPACQQPIEPHRHEAITGGRLHHCATCLSDLRRKVRLGTALKPASFQALADGVIRDGQGSVGPNKVVSTEWFATARYFLGVLRKVANGRAGRLIPVLNTLGVVTRRLVSPPTGLTLETLRTHERHNLLTEVGTLMEIGLQGLIDEMIRTATPPHALLDVRLTPPPQVTLQLAHAVKARQRKLKSQSNQPSSKRAVMRKLARLRRKVRQ